MENFDSIHSIVSTLNQLANQAVGIYAIEVDLIIQSQSKNGNEIERTLDGMLDFCFHKDMLVLYKKLCSYYFFTNPVATASYITAYRELWDSDEE